MGIGNMLDFIQRASQEAQGQRRAGADQTLEMLQAGFQAKDPRAMAQQNNPGNGFMGQFNVPTQPQSGQDYQAAAFHPQVVVQSGIDMDAQNKDKDRSVERKKVNYANANEKERLRLEEVGLDIKQQLADQADAHGLISLENDKLGKLNYQHRLEIDGARAQAEKALGDRRLDLDELKMDQEGHFVAQDGNGALWVLDRNTGELTSTQAKGKTVNPMSELLRQATALQDIIQTDGEHEGYFWNSDAEASLESILAQIKKLQREMAPKEEKKEVTGNELVDGIVD